MQPSSSPAVVETLERRDLFTGFVFKNHRLSVIGDANLPNTITVALMPDQLSIAAQILVHAPRSTLTFNQTYPLSDGIDVVIIRGGNKDDLINVDQTYGSFPIPCGMAGGGGADTILGGDEPDLMEGGPGNDYLSGGGGNDTLLGQTGNDTLVGGPGNDFLAGSFGDDDMVGGDGNDTLADARGSDTVLGGPGNNVFFIRSFRLDSVNDFNLATDKVHYVTNDANNAGGSSSLLTSLFPIFSL